MKLDLTKPMRWKNHDIKPPRHVGTLSDGRLVIEWSDGGKSVCYCTFTEAVADQAIENIPERVVRWYALLIPQGGYHTLEELQRDCPSAQAIRCEFEGERAVDVAIEEAT